MDTAIISGLVGGIVAVVIGSLITRSIRKSEIDGQLKYGIFLFILGCCSFAFVILAVFAFFNDADAWEKPSELYSIVGLFVGFGAISVYSFGEYFKVHGTFDPERIDFYTPWTGWKHEQWENLERVKFNSQASWFVLTFKSGKKIRLSNFLSGHGKVLELLKSKGYEF
ncbi:hypothetical protein SG34_020160 [Thalassomonas viridans]|uniref:Uncharacterized protein n=1 Tax=Thalassomonas viridans TaxID=137584 RepID=A0AAE9YZ98_9GAMM|nr:hypothetical protein [Thalassomonas viridans]WDE03678.1 hypothetical protein SG34_020160 [Thalassomonas viridans]